MRSLACVALSSLFALAACGGDDERIPPVIDAPAPDAAVIDAPTPIDAPAPDAAIDAAAVDAPAAIDAPVDAAPDA